MKPTCIDLCCGLGGWTKGFQAAGFDCTGLDIADFSCQYPGRFILGSVFDFEKLKLGGFDCVVASPPCQEYSRWWMPWLKKKNPPFPDTRIWAACVYIAYRNGGPWAIENVRGAIQFQGPAAGNVGPYYLWGPHIPLLLPNSTQKKDSKRGNSNTPRAQRVAQASEIPLELSYTVARHFRTLLCKN